MIVAIDTMVLIWALPHVTKKVKRQTVQDTSDLQRRAGILLHELSEENVTIVVPTITASEWLTGIDTNHHGTFLAELEKQFLLAPFDLPSAACAARLFQLSHAIPKETKPTRVCLKADVLIVATAKMAGATAFFSNDAHVRDLAKLVGMASHDLPRQAKSLFADAEMKTPPDHQPDKKSDRRKR